MKPTALLARIRVHAPWAVLTLLAGLLVTTVGTLQTWRDNRQTVADAVVQQANRLADAVIGRVSLYQYGLRGAAGTVYAAGVERITREQFRAYIAARDLPHEFPGARGFGVVRRVPESQLASFVERARADNWPDFSVHGFDPHSGDRLIIQYMEPTARNLGAVGLDIGSEANRLKAALDSTRLGLAQITAPITLVQDIGQPSQSFLMLLPLYRTPEIPTTAQARIDSSLGWTYVALVMSEMLQALNIDRQMLQLEFYDVTHGDTPLAFYSSGPKPENDLDGAGRYQVERPVFGRVWRLQFTAYPKFVDSVRQTSAWLVAILGSLASLLLALLVQLLKLNQRRQQIVVAQQARLAAIVESSADAIISMDLEGTITSWNRGAERLFGYSSDQVLGRILGLMLDPDGDTAQRAQYLQRVARGEVVRGLETVRRHSDGSPLHVSITLSPIHAADGGVIGVSKTVRDISEQKAAEAQILELNRILEGQVQQRTGELSELNTLFESILAAAIDVAIVATDTNGVIRLFNKGAEQMLGYSAAEMIGQCTPEVYHDPEELAAMNASMASQFGRPLQGVHGFIHNALRQGVAQHYQCQLVRKNGERFAVQLLVSTIRDVQGELTGFLGIAIDVTAQRQLELSLQLAKEEADAANRAKSAFLANMSHEIRTPMNAVLGMLHLVLQTELSRGQHDFISKAQTAARLLLGLLNDILDYSKIEAGKLHIERLPFEIDVLLQDLAVVLAGNQTQNSVEMIFDIDPQLPAVLIGDRLRLQQVLINLTGNALKFTSIGQVVLSVRELQRSNHDITLRFAVVDSGIGMNAEQLRRIFEGFTQAEISITRRFGGTGLGLLICRRLTRMMGSELNVESDLHVGSRFWFDLTLALGEQPAELLAQRQLATPQALSVLVVDDNPVSAEILLRTLQGLGWQGEHASNAEQAFAALHASQSRSSRFDVVLMDWRMPEIDGLDAAAQIRQRADLQPSPPVVMITAYGQEALMQAHGSGERPYVAVLSKPVTVGQLSRALADAARGLAMVQYDKRISAPQTPKRLLGRRLLLVEDNKVNQLVASAMLRAEGAEVDVAAGGIEGVHSVMAATVPYDAVLMDVQMPDIDGFEATRRIRAQQRFSRLPIVAMTANVTESDRRECFSAGMNEHVGKPIELDKLVSILLNFL